MVHLPLTFDVPYFRDKKLTFGHMEMVHIHRSFDVLHTGIEYKVYLVTSGGLDRAEISQIIRNCHKSL